MATLAAAAGPMNAFTHSSGQLTMEGESWGNPVSTGVSKPVIQSSQSKFLLSVRVVAILSKIEVKIGVKMSEI